MCCGETIFDLTGEEKQRLPELIATARKLILREYQPEGFNIGMNCGEAAGFLVFFIHGSSPTVNTEFAIQTVLYHVLYQEMTRSRSTAALTCSIV
ncbi:hypothetical protein SAMN05660226_02312 [Parapedobacter luteus]|uniref:Uncharacterized protein n=1 Tax=Parapedobacter luteus TaxID=623280 RepID=A0A1T5CSS7_9SPHI|nr:hypothetical protein SAMN05660226_02312 [Parapedobacter luteus]